MGGATYTVQASDTSKVRLTAIDGTAATVSIGDKITIRGTTCTVEGIDADVFSSAASLQNVEFSLSDSTLYEELNRELKKCPNPIHLTITGTSGCSGVLNESAFYGNAKISKVTFGEGISSVGDTAFSSCSALVSVDWGEVESVGWQAFTSCAFTRLDIPVKTIGNNAFDRCKSLEILVLEEGVETVGEYAFYGCTQLGTIYIPASVNSIGRYAFTSCAAAPSVYYAGTTEKWNSLKAASPYAWGGSYNVSYWPDWQPWPSQTDELPQQADELRRALSLFDLR